MVAVANFLVLESPVLASVHVGHYTDIKLKYMPLF